MGTVDEAFEFRAWDWDDFRLNSLLDESTSVSPQWHILQMGPSDPIGSTFSNFLPDWSWFKLLVITRTGNGLTVAWSSGYKKVKSDNICKLLMTQCLERYKRKKNK